MQNLPQVFRQSDSAEFDSTSGEPHPAAKGITSCNPKFVDEIWPKSTPTDSGEERLLNFVQTLILDLARTHPRVTQKHVLEWLTFVVAWGQS